MIQCAKGTDYLKNDESPIFTYNPELLNRATFLEPLCRNRDGNSRSIRHPFSNYQDPDVESNRQILRQLGQKKLVLHYHECVLLSNCLLMCVNTYACSCRHFRSVDGISQSESLRDAEIERHITCRMLLNFVLFYNFVCKKYV